MLPGEIYLDPRRRTYSFFGITRTAAAAAAYSAASTGSGGWGVGAETSVPGAAIPGPAEHGLPPAADQGPGPPGAGAVPASAVGQGVSSLFRSWFGMSHGSGQTSGVVVLEGDRLLYRVRPSCFSLLLSCFLRSAPIDETS